MARGPLSIIGFGAAAVVVALCFGTLAAVISRAEGVSGLSLYDWYAVRFTIWQAFLSSVLSLACAIPLAGALFRRRFWGKPAFITLLGAPFILPVLAAILGLQAVFGRSGIVSDILALIGIEPISIYGLHGILLAHMFFNLPLATRMILMGYAALPTERLRLCASLNLSPLERFRHLTVPMLRETVPGVFAVIFLICTTSFAVALTFGGGPKATTVELAIYEAFRFDFDLGKAALLAILQFLIGGCAVLMAFKLRLPQLSGRGFDRQIGFSMRDPLRVKLLDSLMIFIAAAFLLTPLAMIVLRGAGGLLTLPMSVWQAALRSILTALGSTVLAIVLAFAISNMRHRAYEWIGTISLVASPLVMGVGLYVVVLNVATPSDLALIVTAVVNAVMALPFLLRALIPAQRAIERDYGRLAQSLSLTGFMWLRVVVLPRVRGPLGFGAGLAAALSMGDLGVITLFAPSDGATLPLQIFRLMGSYQMDQAMAGVLLLVVLSFTLFTLFDLWGWRDA